MNGQMKDNINNEFNFEISYIEKEKKYGNYRKLDDLNDFKELYIIVSRFKSLVIEEFETKLNTMGEYPARANGGTQPVLRSMKLFYDSDFKDIIDKASQFYKFKEAHYCNMKLNKADKLYIVGDIHSSLYNLLQIVFKLMVDDVIDDSLKVQKDKYLVFLGDIVDRGPYSIECLMVVFKLKLLNPARVLILSGNHESPKQYKKYGFKYELDAELLGEDADEIIKNCAELLTNLPIVAFAKYDGDDKAVQLCHGGIDLHFSGKNYSVYNPICCPTYNTYPESGISGPKKFVYRQSFFDDEEMSYKNGFLYGDFTSNHKSEKHPGKDYREKVGTADTMKYLGKNKLIGIISGHQDKSSVLVQLSDEKDGYKPSTIPDYSKKEKTQLYVPPKNEYIILGDSGVLSVITSTAVGSKGNSELRESTYLTMSKHSENKVTLQVNYIRINEPNVNIKWLKLFSDKYADMEEHFKNKSWKPGMVYSEKELQEENRKEEKLKEETSLSRRLHLAGTPKGYQPAEEADSQTPASMRDTFGNPRRGKIITGDGNLGNNKVKYFTQKILKLNELNEKLDELSVDETKKNDIKDKINEIREKLEAIEKNAKTSGDTNTLNQEDINPINESIKGLHELFKSVGFDFKSIPMSKGEKSILSELSQEDFLEYTDKSGTKKKEA